MVNEEEITIYCFLLNLTVLNICKNDKNFRGVIFLCHRWEFVASVNQFKENDLKADMHKSGNS